MIFDVIPVLSGCRCFAVKKGTDNLLIKGSVGLCKLTSASELLNRTWGTGLVLGFNFDSGLLVSGVIDKECHYEADNHYFVSVPLFHENDSLGIISAYRGGHCGPFKDVISYMKTHFIHKILEHEYRIFDIADGVILND